ncbi:MAG: hypothetical protein U0324_20400 [Polyangiales bacterium]
MLADDNVARALLARGNAVVTAAVDAAHTAGLRRPATRARSSPRAALLLRTMESLATSRLTDAQRARSRPATTSLPRLRAGTTSPCSRRAPTCEVFA